jgi:hypothetical protein
VIRTIVSALPLARATLRSVVLIAFVLLLTLVAFPAVLAAAASR